MKSLKNYRRIPVLALIAMLAFVQTGSGGEPEYGIKEDVIYGRKWGTALTMDVFTPEKNRNGRGVILVLSGGWYSAKGVLGLPFMREMLNRGYTVFAVTHGSQPKYTIPEAVEDLYRSVRFIRYKAADYEIDPQQLGVYGGSAGGHLSLMLGLAGKDGDPNAKDPVDRLNSQVQAVACFYPPTDFLNFGEPGKVVVGKGVLPGFKAPFDFKELDPKSNSFVPVTDEAKHLEIGREISPATHIDANDAPTLIIHGDADTLVPLQQSELLIDKLNAAGVPHELIVRKGAGHGWKNLEGDIAIFADWFDKHLSPTNAKTPQ